MGDVAGYDEVAGIAEAGHAHEDLFMGGILSFIEDDEGVGEGTAAHVGEWGDFDEVILEEAVGFFDAEDIVEGVVKGAEIGEDFFS